MAPLRAQIAKAEAQAQKKDEREKAEDEVEWHKVAGTRLNNTMRPESRRT